MNADFVFVLVRNPSNGFDIRWSDGIFKSNPLTGYEVGILTAFGEPIQTPGAAEWARLR